MKYNTYTDHQDGTFTRHRDNGSGELLTRGEYLEENPRRDRTRIHA